MIIDISARGSIVSVYKKTGSQKKLIGSHDMRAKYPFVKLSKLDHESKNMAAIAKILEDATGAKIDQVAAQKLIFQRTFDAKSVKEIIKA